MNEPKLEVDYEAMLRAARREAEMWRKAKDELAARLNAGIAAVEIIERQRDEARAEVDRWRAEAESWHAQYLRVFAETLVLADRVSVLEAELRSAKESNG